METWWQSLNLPLQIFYCIGIVSGILLVIQTIATLLGFGDHSDMEMGVEHPDDLGILSIRTVTGFFFGFGWSGIIAIKAGMGLPLAIFIALVVGSVFLAAIYFLMRALFSLRADGTLDYKNAIGNTGTVYATVPPNKSGSGQIEVMIQGRLSVIQSMTSDSESLPPGTKVKVINTIDQGTLEISKL